MSKYNDILEKVNNSNEYEDLATRSKHESVWDTHRTNATKVADLYNNSDFDNYHRRMEDCASRLDFKQVVDPATGEVNIKLKKTFFCRVRHCPVCQWRRSLFWKSRFYKALPEISKNHKTARWVFLTLTVKNCNVKNLNETIGKMNHGFRKMCKRKHFLKYNLGFVKTIEITRNKETNEAHPHFHILLLQRRKYFDDGYMEKDDWAELWRDCLNISYIPQVNVQAVKLRGKSKDDKDKELVDAVKETLKYAVKPADMVQDRGWFLEMTNQLFKSRLLSTGGVLKNSFKEDVTEEEMLLNEQEEEQGDDLNLITFNWYKSLFKYRRKLNNDVVQADDSKAYLKHKHKTINAIKQRIQDKQDERAEHERVIKHIAELEALVKAKIKEDIDKLDVPTVTI